MNDTKWGRWLQEVTQETTVRGMSFRIGVSHTTVRKWIANGVPDARVWDITVRFKGDVVKALVLLGHIEPDQVRHLNHKAWAEYAPTVVLTHELHKRATASKQMHPHIKMQKLHAVM